MPGSYSHVTRQDLIDQLAQELNDSGKVFSVEGELTASVNEALRVWNVLTGYNRTTKIFNTTAGTAFYDLASQFSSQLGHTVTDRSVVGDIQYRLMETYEPIAGSWSEMFTHASMVRSLQQRRDRFLAETESEITRKAAIAVQTSESIVPLDDTVITVLRAVWKTPGGQYYLLTPTDESTATSMMPVWRQQSGVPRFYSLAHQANLNIQLFPPPATAGELHLMTVDTGSTLHTATPVVLGVHDDLAWGIGWGAVEDQLLRDGIGRDPQRAQFAAQMYALAVDLARNMPTVLGVAINEVQVQPVSLHMLDRMRSGWEGRNRDKPTTAALLGDWLALYPVPDGSYSISVTMVEKAPLPAVSANLQLGREQITAIISWAKQLAMFKQEGSQLQQGVQAGGMLIEQARLYNEQRIMKSQYLTEMYGSSQDGVWNAARAAQPEVLADSDARDTASSRQSRGRDSGYERPRKRLGGR